MKWSLKRRQIPFYSHYIAQYMTVHDKEDVLDSILMAMNSINGKEEELRISIASKIGEVDCRVKFEVRLVRGKRLRRINRRAVEIIRREFIKDNLDAIDFIIKISYKYNGGRAWSDKYLVRFQIGNVTFRIYISSVGGLRRITPKEMGRRIYLEIIRSLRRRGFRPIIRRVHERI